LVSQELAGLADLFACGFFAAPFFVVLGTGVLRTAFFVVVDGGAGMALRALLDASR
jgi:hypothetical protein